MITTNTIELSEPETDDFLRHMDLKIMWKDQSKSNDENLSHGATITPLRTISTSHYWIKRNLIPIIDTNGLYCYISGCNLILSCADNSEPQKIIPLKPNAIVTSLYCQISSTSERLIIVGQKIRPPVCEMENANYPFTYTGRVEIFNLDKKILEEKRILEHSYYVHYESFIYDAIVPAGTDYCLTILKNIDISEPDTKVFIWDYVHLTMLCVQEFDHHIESIVPNTEVAGMYIFYSLYYCAVWNYAHTKKKFFCEIVLINDNKEISDACFIKAKNFSGICISYRSQRLEIYNCFHELYKAFNFAEIFSSLGGVNPSSSMNIIPSFNIGNQQGSQRSSFSSSLLNLVNHSPSTTHGELHRQAYNIGNMNNYGIYQITEENDAAPRDHTLSKDEPSKFNDKSSDSSVELLKESPMFSSLGTNMNNILKNYKLDNKNTIKYIISRDNYIFIFFLDSDVYFVLEFLEVTEDVNKSGYDIDKSFSQAENTDINFNYLANKTEFPKGSANTPRDYPNRNSNQLAIANMESNQQMKVVTLKIATIDKLNNKVVDNSTILIDSNLSKMLHITGTVSKSLFMSKFEQTRKTIFIQNRDKKIFKPDYNISKGKDVEVIKHKFEKVKMKYHWYRVSYLLPNINTKENIIKEVGVNVTKNINNMNILSNAVIQSNYSPVGTPAFTYLEELFPNTGVGQEVSNLSISVNPRIILAGYDKKHLNIFQQHNIDEVNLQNLMTGKVLNSSSTIVSNRSNNSASINLSSFINLDSSPSMQNQWYNHLQKYTTVSLHNTKTFEQQPITITISPYGNLFFITSEETSFLYALLDKEIKEIAKINSYCHAASFSKSGKLLAFSNTEYRTERLDYNIIILNTMTFEVEYIISKLALPVKLTWIDYDSKILALFQDTSTNILGWKLNENRYIIYNSKDSGKVLKNFSDFNDNDNEDSNLILKLTDYTEKIVDFAYDDVIDYLVICSEERRVKVIQSNKDDVYWEFPVGCKYCSVLLIKKLDIILFGTSEGSIRVLLWPITNFTGKEQIDHPHFSEKFLHSDNVNSLVISPDLQFLYSASADGSIYVSTINAVAYDNNVNLNSFAYFDNRNILSKKMHMKYSDLINMTDGVYKNKLENIEKRQTDIQTLNSEFVTEMEKMMGENIKDIEKKRKSMNEDIEIKRRTVKNLEDEKEILSKQLKDKRENQVKLFREELAKIKNKYKTEKENLQNQTKTLTIKIKESRGDFAQEVAKIENRREETNNRMKSSLDNLLKMLNEKYIQVEVLIKMKNEGFKKDLNKYEYENETQIRDKDDKLRDELNRHMRIKKEIENEISKIKKYNQNYDDKIKEWESHLQELKNNNTDLMESFLFNTLKLKQMNNLLKENEKKISENESEVKKQRTVNDRLEQLRYVLEYQIKNLIKEKTPIEEQIKNFEELHNDFYKRFNLLYAEQLNIDEFISSNSQLIEVFKEQLKLKKRSLYNLKNLFRNVDLEINFIFKNKIEDKNSIVNKLIDVYNRHLKDYVDDEASPQNDTTENKLQAKLIEKEINKQKNKVLKDLIQKRQDRKDVNFEKDDLMIKIRLENQQLIEECSSIRMNLEDILKYINDIEKKFIELTNTHLFLNKNENTKMIRENIKLAKKSIMLADVDKTRVAKGNSREALAEKSKTQK
jgi:hypothetical protein